MLIIPKTHGKADSEIINMLFEIKNILHRYRVEIVSFSFDGDKAFKILHQVFYQSYINTVLKSNSILNYKIKCVRISPDFLHLGKRFRYRFLSNKLHINFKKNSPFIDIKQIQMILKNVPDIVFNNSPMTKMHDSLPLCLFSLHNFIQLFDKKMFESAAFWFPIALTIAAYNEKEIGYKNRYLFFECAFWFVIYLKKNLNECTEEKYPEKKYKEKCDVIAFTNDMLMEFSNILFSNLNLMEKFKNIYLRRNSTSPLENTFGRARVRSKNIHTLKKFLSIICQMNNESFNSTCKSIEKVKGRTSNFGVIVEDKIDMEEDEFEFVPQQIALDLLNLIDVESSSGSQNHDQLYSFVEYLRNFAHEEKPNKININHLTLGTGQTKTISQRISFKLESGNDDFNDFFKQQFPDQKLNKCFLKAFYEILMDIFPEFPSIDDQNNSKKAFLEHLNKNFLKYQEYYFDALNYI